MKILLVIDIQKQFKDTSGVYEQCIQYIEENRKDYDKVIAVVFKQDKKLNSNFSKYLDWEQCLEASDEDLDFKADLTVLRYGYSCYPELLCSAKDDIFIIGANVETSILAACFNLWDAGYNFHIIPEYVYSSSNIYKDDIIRLMKKIFGKAILSDENYPLTLLQIINKKMDELLEPFKAQKNEQTEVNISNDFPKKNI